MQTIRVQGSGFTRLISRQSGAGSILVTNTSLTVTVFLTDKDVGNPATTDSVTLGPNTSKTFDGSTDVYGFVTGGSADVEVIEGGVATFLGLTQSSGILVLPSIRSSNFVTTVSGYSVNNDGSAEFNNLTIRGTFIGADFIINASGAFFYNGTPATGNLVASITTAAGTDSFGNAYKKHITVYGPASTYVEALASTTAKVGLGTGDAAEVTPGLIDTLITGSGITRSFAMIAQSPIASGLAGHLVQLQLYGPSVDGTTFPPQAVLQAADGTNTSAMAVEPTGVIATGALTAVTGTAANPTLITTDGWHSLGTLAGYTVTVGRYRLTTWGAYELDINVTSLGANAANTTFSVALPAGYSGGSSIAYPLTANYVLTAGNAYPRLIVTSGGVVTIAQTASKSGLITGQAFVPAT